MIAARERQYQRYNREVLNGTVAPEQVIEAIIGYQVNKHTEPRYVNLKM